MKRLPIILFLCLICFSAQGAVFQPEEISQINQRLDRILLEAQDLSTQKKTRIIANVKFIQQILAEKKNRKNSMNDLKEESENKDQVPGLNRSDRLRPEDVRLYDAQQFKELKVRIKAAWPFKNQLVMIKRINTTTSFTIQQILEITKLLDFQSDQKNVAILLLPNAFDLENVDLLYGLFWTADDKEMINKIADEHLR